MFLYGGMSLKGADAAVFTLQNRCNKTIWPGRPQLMNTGFQLNPNQKSDIVAPTGWSGHIWARSGCIFDQSTKQRNCTTGDCSGRLECSGADGAPPASLAEFTLDSPEDFYDVSLLDGFNLPISIVSLSSAPDRSNNFLPEELYATPSISDRSAPPRLKPMIFELLNRNPEL
ncbi:hypothetical protein BUALT_Bualt07G0137500 [Buddleja alternifolia]|uniref:Thaumatin-like protein 1 n=1 Tax=Buddleja alternifolia TaxID=168488 RepID=A0AAV6XH25_9LAMI|nr:hypothetical protein BUALT_Bualt07G0137500 [Buddleja alternifolia]